MATLGRRVSALLPRLAVRNFSLSSQKHVTVKARMEKFILENPACFPDVHYYRSIVLYRDMPMRCQCGHWFKLIDMDVFEKEREKRWAQIKNEPENAKLEQDLTNAENELTELMEKGKNMTNRSMGSTDMLEKMSHAWDNYKNSYIAIRHRMDLP